MSSVASSAAVGPPPGMAVRLSSNESPFGPSPKVVEAIRDLASEVHLYPDDQSRALRDALADEEGVTFGEVACGTGSAGLLMDLVGHACRDGGSVLSFERGFIVYRLAARNAGAAYVEAPTGGPATPGEDGYRRDPEALIDAIDDDTRLVVIDNPGNPTGAHLTGDELASVIAAVPENVTIAVDEAYSHFATGQRGYVRARALDVEHPRLVTLSTFSKAHALAGLRVGYIVGPSELIGELDAWRVRFNLNSAAQRAALASLRDREHLETTVRGTLDGRARMADGLRELGVPFSDSLGNFLTIELGGPAAPVVEAFATHGVGVRPLMPYGMLEQIRVSVGTRAEVDIFLEAAADVLAGVASRG